MFNDELHENEIGSMAIELAISLHRDLGPGLLETVYEVLMADGLAERGLSVERQKIIPIDYANKRFEEGFRADLVLNKKVIIELKSVEKVIPAHKKQVLTYLKLSGMKLGYLFNFGEGLMKDGITRVINGDLAQCASCHRERKN